MPQFPVSSIVDNIILLSMVELGSSLHRCLTVVKARGSKHEFDSREYQIGQGGLSLLPVGANAAESRSTFELFQCFEPRAYPLSEHAGPWSHY